MAAYSERYGATLTLAARTHRNRMSKAGRVPPGAHRVSIPVIPFHAGSADDNAVPELLHDVVADQNVPSWGLGPFRRVHSGVAAVARSRVAAHHLVGKLDVARDDGQRAVARIAGHSAW